MNPSLEESRELVKKRVMRHEHAFRVFDVLTQYGYDYEICHVGLLSDVLDVGGLTSEELTKLGYSKNFVSLVELVTLTSPELSYWNRQLASLNRLVDAGREDAWTIKAAIALDDLRCADTLNAEGWFTVCQKFAPALAYFLRPFYGTPLIDAYVEEMRNHNHPRRAR